MTQKDDISISVCISVKNGQEHINQCLESILNQTLKTIEIIIVNNGSTDETPNIIKEYEIKFPLKIRIFNQENKGLALGRQRGISEAKGRYVAFLDVDDYLKPHALEKLYAYAINHQVDIVEFKTLKGDEIIGSGYKGTHNTRDILKDYFLLGQIPSMLWLRLYNRAIFEKQVLPEIYVNNEDIFAFPCLLYAAQSILFVDEQLHSYTVDNSDSVMYRIKNSNVSQEKILKNRIKTLMVVNHIREFIGVEKIDTEFSEEFKAFSARTVLNFCLQSYNLTSKDKLVKLVEDTTNIKLKELKQTFKKLIHYNKYIQYSTNLLGFQTTFILYRLLKKTSTLNT